MNNSRIITITKNKQTKEKRDKKKEKQKTTYGLIVTLSRKLKALRKIEKEVCCLPYSHKFLLSKPKLGVQHHFYFSHKKSYL